MQSKQSSKLFNFLKRNTAVALGKSQNVSENWISNRPNQLTLLSFLRKSCTIESKCKFDKYFQPWTAYLKVLSNVRLSKFTKIAIKLANCKSDSPLNWHHDLILIKIVNLDGWNTWFVCRAVSFFSGCSHLILSMCTEGCRLWLYNTWLFIEHIGNTLHKWSSSHCTSGLLTLACYLVEVRDYWRGS